MNEHKLEKFVHEHKKAELTTAVGLGAAAVSSAAYMMWRRQHREARTYEPALQSAGYDNQLSIFDEERIRPRQVRELLATVAARIHYATFNTTEQVVTREQLEKQLITVDVHHLQKALSYLQDKEYDLVGRRQSAMDEKSQGYYSKPALNWGVEQGEQEALLQAYADLINQQYNGNSQ